MCHRMQLVYYDFSSSNACLFGVTYNYHQNSANSFECSDAPFDVDMHPDLHPSLRSDTLCVVRQRLIRSDVCHPALIVLTMLFLTWMHLSVV
jgi:hypothetical protein